MQLSTPRASIPPGSTRLAIVSQALEGFGGNPRTELLTTWEHNIPVSF